MLASRGDNAFPGAFLTPIVRMPAIPSRFDEFNAQNKRQGRPPNLTASTPNRPAAQTQQQGPGRTGQELLALKNSVKPTPHLDLTHGTLFHHGIVESLDNHKLLDMTIADVSTGGARGSSLGRTTTPRPPLSRRQRERARRRTDAAASSPAAVPFEKRTDHMVQRSIYIGKEKQDMHIPSVSRRSSLAPHSQRAAAAREGCRRREAASAAHTPGPPAAPSRAGHRPLLPPRRLPRARRRRARRARL